MTESGVKKITITSVEGKMLFATRHRLSGLSALAERPSILHVVEGIIEAPDHHPLILRGPHIIGQTKFLHDPAKAD